MRHRLLSRDWKWYLCYQGSQYYKADGSRISFRLGGCPDEFLCVLCRGFAVLFVFDAELAAVTVAGRSVLRKERGGK